MKPSTFVTILEYSIFFMTSPHFDLPTCTIDISVIFLVITASWQTIIPMCELRKAKHSYRVFEMSILRTL